MTLGLYHSGKQHGRRILHAWIRMFLYHLSGVKDCLKLKEMRDCASTYRDTNTADQIQLFFIPPPTNFPMTSDQHE